MKNGIKNCWEYMECGREPDGRHAGDQGVCPAAIEQRLDGINSGKNAGRICWLVAGTFCHGETQGTFARKFFNCNLCSFFQQVSKDEGANLILETEYLDEDYKKSSNT